MPVRRPPSDPERLARMQRSFDKDRAILAEDYDHFAGSCDFVNQPDRHGSFEERKSAYLGLLDAYHRAAVEATDAAAKAFAYWQVRCDLVAPESVREAAAQIVETNENRAGRLAATDALIKAMRADLGIARRL